MAMKHCVASYGSQIGKSNWSLYSIRNSHGIPRCTIQWVESTKTALQVKGPQDQTVPNDVIDNTKRWLVAHGVKQCDDQRLLKVNSIKQIYDEVAQMESDENK